MRAFIDSWAWLGSFDRRDAHHEFASRVVLDKIESKTRLVTTDYVLSETITLLFRRANAGIQSQVLRDLLAFIDAWKVDIEPITPSRFSRALELRFRYEDKPNISFADLTSMVVMRELQITEILTADERFEKVNLGFRIVPVKSNLWSQRRISNGHTKRLAGQKS